MKRVLLLVVVTVLCLAATSFAAGQKYVGIKTGLMMLDVANVNDIIPIGVFGGYEFLPRMAIEGEFNYRLSGGDVDFLSHFGGTKFEYKLWTLGAYFVYRYPIKPEFYLKGKAGFVHSHATAKATYGIYTFDASGSDDNLSIGVGAGYMFSGTLGLEGEYTMMSSDVNYLSIGLVKRF
jgi:opacity protein-like surface antigen